MRKWSNLKTWEKQYFLKRAAIVCALLLLASVVAVFVIKPLLTLEEPESLFPKRELRGWDYPTNRSYEVIREGIDSYTLSRKGIHNAYLIVHRVRFEDGEEDKREFPVFWYQGQYCFAEMFLPQQLLWLDRGKDEPGAFAMLFGARGDDQSVIFCVVSVSGDVYDSAGDLLAQIRRDGLVYSYFSVNGLDEDYHLYINGTDCGEALFRQNSGLRLEEAELNELFREHAKRG